jgi:hypothetical protein
VRYPCTRTLCNCPGLSDPGGLENYELVNTAGERIWHTQESQGQILALTFRRKFLKICKLFPPHLEAVREILFFERRRHTFKSCKALHLKEFKGNLKLFKDLPESHGQNLIVTVLYVPHSLDSGTRGSRDTTPCSVTGVTLHGVVSPRW